MGNVISLPNQSISEEKEKLARLLSDELDSALVEAGLIPVGECVPYDTLAPSAKNAIRAAANRLYAQLVYDTANGVIRIIPNSQKV